MKRSVSFFGKVLAVALTVCGALEVSALQNVYSTPGYVFGVFDTYTTGNMSYVPTTPTLAFEGATLEELEPLMFGGWMCGAWISGKGNVRSYFTHAYRDAGGILQFLVVEITINDSNLIKGVVIKLTQGEGGVYAQAVFSGYRSGGTLTDTDFVSISESGDLSFNYTAGSVATEYEGGGYGVCAFNAMLWIPKAAPMLVFKNPAGSPVLRVDDIKNYRFSGITAGSSIFPVKYTRVEAQNKFITYEDGVATKIRLEMQLLDDRYLKCPIVELTNGEGGVYAQVIAARYMTVSGSVALGDPFVDAEGNYLGNNSNIATTPIEGGYGVAGLEASATDAMTYVLDSSKSWSAMTGNANAVNNALLDVTIVVTGADPTLTFDTPVNVHSFVVEAAAGNGVTFSRADGVVPPTATFWNVSGVSGAVTFNGFTPVTDTSTANIQPNSASTLVFNGDLNGLLPYNAAVAVPCAAFVFGGTQAFSNIGFVRAGTVPITLTGTTAFTGTTTLAAGQTLTVASGGAIALDGAMRANGAGGFLRLADGASIQPLGPNVTFASNVTLELPETGYASVKVPSDVADASISLVPDQFAGGDRLVLDAGVLHAVSGEEAFLAVANGGTLVITVSDALIHSGYTSVAEVLEGGVIRFVAEDGTEVGIGRPEMAVLPGTDSAVWSPVEGNDRSFDSAVHWSTGSTPPEGSDVSVLAGDRGSATVEIWRSQQFGQITLGQNAEIVFTLGQPDSGMSLTAGTLAIADGASATIPIASFNCTAVMLGHDSVLRLVGEPGVEQTFSAAIGSTSNGRIEIVSGTVILDQFSTYKGGTLIRSGATAKAGASRTVVDGVYCGAFGQMVAGNVITVEAGGAFDSAGRPDMNYYLNLAGGGFDWDDETVSGALFNSGANLNTDFSQFYGLALSDDAVVRADNAFALVARGHAGTLSLALGDHTLTKTGTNIFALASGDGVSVSGSGTVSIEEGTLLLDKGSMNASSAQLRIGPNGCFETFRSATFQTIENNGVIDITSPRDIDVTIAGTYSGNGIVNKYGQDFTAYMRVNNASRGTVNVYEGRYCLSGVTAVSGNPYTLNTEEEPHANNLVIVHDGGQLDMNGVYDATLSVVLAGQQGDSDPFLCGALANRGGAMADNKCQIVQITLTTNALVCGTANYGILAPSYKPSRLDLGPHTMRLCTQANFWMVNVDITGTGTIAVEQGTLDFRKNPSRGNDWTLDVGVNGLINVAQTFSVSNLVFSGGIAGGTSLITVLGTYRPDSATLPNVMLSGPGAGIDVSGMTQPWDAEASGELIYSPGTTVTVYLGDREVKGDEQLIKWSEIPDYVTQWKLDLQGRDLQLVTRGDGLYLSRSGTVLIFK